VKQRQACGPPVDINNWWGGGVERERKKSKGCFCSVTILLVLPMKPVSSFHKGQECGATG